MGDAGEGPPDAVGVQDQRLPAPDGSPSGARPVRSGWPIRWSCGVGAPAHTKNAPRPVARGACAARLCCRLPRGRQRGRCPLGVAVAVAVLLAASPGRLKGLPPSVARGERPHAWRRVTCSAPRVGLRARPEEHAYVRGDRAGPPARRTWRVTLLRGRLRWGAAARGPQGATPPRPRSLTQADAPAWPPPGTGAGSAVPAGAAPARGGAEPQEAARVALAPAATRDSSGGRRARWRPGGPAPGGRGRRPCGPGRLPSTGPVPAYKASLLGSPAVTVPVPAHKRAPSGVPTQRRSPRSTDHARPLIHQVPAGAPKTRTAVPARAPAHRGALAKA